MFELCYSAPMHPSTPFLQAPLATPTPRADGEATRQRLLDAALSLFANQGFAQTSVREIAQAAQANVAAISYHFGDKAGLYRAVFFEPVSTVEEDLARFGGDDLTLEQALQGYFDVFLAPLLDGDTGRLCVKLRMREMLEPTGLWQEEIEHGLRPMHQQLVQVVGRHLGLVTEDDELHRLAISIMALGVQLHIGQEVVASVAPQLLGTGAPLMAWRECLVRQARAMVEAERLRRADQLPPSSGNASAVSTGGR
ncbi:CerR family C-terminal domain-containing protein [Hydrogenophaga soli]